MDLKVAKCNRRDLLLAHHHHRRRSQRRRRFASLAIGNDGFPVVAYFDATPTALKVVRCNDLACAPGGETYSVVDDPLGGGDTWGISLAISDDDFPVISYNSELGSSLYVAKCNDVACAGGNESIYPVGRSYIADDTSIAIASDGFPIIAYGNWDTNNQVALSVAKCHNASCRD